MMVTLPHNTPGQPHRWAEAIAAWARGDLVQWRFITGDSTEADWRDCDFPSRGRPNFECDHFEFRVVALAAAEAQPIAEVVRDGATVRLQWASVQAAHNAKPGPLYAAPVARPVAVPQAMNREALVDLIAERLSGTYHCMRVWEAWHVGTMSQDDFADVGESETPADLADEVLAMLAAAPAAPAVQPDAPMTATQAQQRLHAGIAAICRANEDNPEGRV